MKSFKIEVIGSGCKKCKALLELTKEVVAELGIKNTVEYSTDISRMVTMGVMSSPVLVIDGKAVLAGVLPDREKLKAVISEHVSDNEQNHNKSENEKCTGCGCGGSC